MHLSSTVMYENKNASSVHTPDAGAAALVKEDHGGQCKKEHSQHDPTLPFSDGASVGSTAFYVL